MMIRIAIVEDNPEIRGELQEWVDSTPDYRCVCACADSESALVQFPDVKPDVVLMDIRFPEESGIADIARLKSLMPALQIIVVTVYRDRHLIFQALKAGASGYLLKRSSPEELLQAIAEVLSGGAPMTGEIARMVVEAFQKSAAEIPDSEELSAREMAVLELVARGLTNKEIGPELNIRYDTVRAHLRRIFEKLHVHCRTEAVMKYTQGQRSMRFREKYSPSL